MCEDLRVAADDEAGPISVGIDVGGTKTLGVAVTSGRVLHRVQLPTRLGASGVLGTAHDVYRALEAELAGRPVEAVGVGVPGVVDAPSGVVCHAVNLALDGMPLAAELSERVGTSVAVENDVNVAALGAAAALGTSESLALLNLGTGLAVGVVLGGRIYRGASGAVGEIGHIPVESGAGPCACGQEGCLELLVSGTAFRAVLERDPGASGADGAAFFDRLAWTVQLVTVAVDASTIVLAGGVTAHRTTLTTGLRRALARREERSPFVASLGLSSRIAVLDPEFPSGAVGAAMYGLASRPGAAAQLVAVNGQHDPS